MTDLTLTIAEERRLTARQANVLEFIKDSLVGNGYPPTVREIGLHFGISSPNGVACHLKALERKGMIRVAKNISRGIVVVAHRNLCPVCGHKIGGGR